MSLETDAPQSSREIHSLANSLSVRPGAEHPGHLSAPGLRAKKRLWHSVEFCHAAIENQYASF